MFKINRRNFVACLGAFSLGPVFGIDLAPKSDSFFPNLDADPCWQRLEEEQWQEEDGLRYCFVTYKKIG